MSPIPGPEAAERFARADAIPPVVVLAGEETFLADEAVAAISRALFPTGDPGGAILSLDASVAADAERTATVIEELGTPSLFGDGKLVVIRRAESLGKEPADLDADDEDGDDEAEEESPSARVPVTGSAPAAAAKLAAGAPKPARRASPITTLVKGAMASAQPGSVLVLATRKPVRGKESVSADAIERAGAALVDCRRLYDSPSPWARGSPFDTEVARWVVRRAKSLHGKSIDPRTAHALATRQGASLSGLAQSLATLSAYVGERPAIAEADVAATVGGTREDPAWVLADAVLDRDVARALDLVGAAFDRGLSDGRGHIAVRPEAIFPRLEGALHAAWRRAMLVCEAAARGENAASAPALAGLPSFVVERAVRQASSRSPDDLLRRHRAFVEAEAGVRGGGVPPRVAAERLVIALTR